MLNLLTFLQVLSLLYFVDGWFRVNELIIGGESTKIEEVPYQAALYYRDFYFCAGSIITRKHILSAAHCLEYFVRKPSGLTVRVGTSKMRSGGEVFKVFKVILHPKFTPMNIDYDAGIIELNDFLKLKDSIQPLKVGAREPKAGEEVRVSGWGFIREIGPPSRKLQSVRIKMVDRKLCTTNYKHILPITNRMICASGDKKDACYGDSGGPLVYQDKLVGIVSSGEGCARKDFPGIYTNVADPDIRKFIKNITHV